MLVGIIPFSVLGVIALNNSQQALQKQVTGQTESTNLGGWGK
jgi:hypothetical protein